MVRLGGNRWVEVKQKTKTDPLLTFLVEFGTQTLPQTGGTPGPLHNQIPAPDRVIDGQPTDDNSTLWCPTSAAPTTRSSSSVRRRSR